MSEGLTNFELTIGDIIGEFIEYFDIEKNEVDIKAQKLMENLSEKSIERAKVVEVNDKMIVSIKKLLDANCARLRDRAVLATIRSSENTDIYDKEAIKADLTTGFCVFIKSDDLDESISIDNPIGLLIVTDWYLDQNQLDYIK